MILRINNTIEKRETKRVQNFLAFKGISYETIVDENTVDIRLCFENGKISTGSVTILRDIEENFPHPIGFIGPIESMFQWSTMALTSYPEISQDILKSIFDEIIEKVEDEYFIMGPTFSVADCVLSADLATLPSDIFLPPLVQEYRSRVEQYLEQ